MLTPNELRRVDLSLACPVQIQTAQRSGEGRILNLSQRGMYVSTSMSISPKAHVLFQLPLPGKRVALRLEGVAVWENLKQIDTPEGYGIRFIKVSPEVRIGIRTLLESNDPPRVGTSAKMPEQDGNVESEEQLANLLLPSQAGANTK